MPAKSTALAEARKWKVSGLCLPAAFRKVLGKRAHAIINRCACTDEKEYGEHRNLEPQGIGKTGCSRLQRIGNETEKAFERQGPIKTLLCSRD